MDAAVRRGVVAAIACGALVVDVSMGKGRREGGRRGRGTYVFQAAHIVETFLYEGGVVPFGLSCVSVYAWDIWRGGTRTEGRVREGRTKA
jgi:hypothetical protein